MPEILVLRYFSAFSFYGDFLLNLYYTCHKDRHYLYSDKTFYINMFILGFVVLSWNSTSNYFIANRKSYFGLQFLWNEGLVRVYTFNLPLRPDIACKIILFGSGLKLCQLQLSSRTFRTQGNATSYKILQVSLTSSDIFFFLRCSTNWFWNSLTK